MKRNREFISIANTNVFIYKSCNGSRAIKGHICIKIAIARDAEVWLVREDSQNVSVSKVIIDLLAKTLDINESEKLILIRLLRWSRLNRTRLMNFSQINQCPYASLVHAALKGNCGVKGVSFALVRW